MSQQESPMNSVLALGPTLNGRFLWDRQPISQGGDVVCLTLTVGVGNSCMQEMERGAWSARARWAQWPTPQFPTIQPFLPIDPAHNIELWPEQQHPSVAVFCKDFSDMSGYSWSYGSSMPMPC